MNDGQKCSVPQYYTVQEVSEIFSLKLRTVYYLIEHDKIKATKIGKAWRVSADEVERLQREGT